jgi:glyoxylase-like metal-dependent hydrolase (beta-lactamase superfamily II)
MIDMLRELSPSPAKYVINTHEDADHVWGNQLFKDAEIIAHQTVPSRMKEVANPREIRKLLRSVDRLLISALLRMTHPGIFATGKQLREDYDFEGIELVFPTTLFDQRHELNLDGAIVDLIYVGPCHQVGDAILHVPGDRVVFCGDIVFRNCTPIGWAGTCEKWIAALDLILDLDPKVIVPGHGGVCGVEGVRDMRAYLDHVMNESKKCFDQGLTSLEAAKRIDFGPFAHWHSPARLYLNVERAYREFRGQPVDTRWNMPDAFDSVYEVARSRGLEIVF